MRLIDLHTDWLLQYAMETTVFEPALYPGAARRWSQSDGYLQATSAAVLSCWRHPDDWARQGDPWSALDALLTRYEAEFSGRLLFGEEDLARWRDDPEGLCWGVLGVRGFDALVRVPADLDGLARLFDRGVRLFQAVDTATSVLAGSTDPGDDRGLTDMGRLFLYALLDLRHDDIGPRPLFDLSHLNVHAASEVLDWFEADPKRSRRIIPVHSHGAIAAEVLPRLRALGGVVGFGVGPPLFDNPEALRAGIESAAALPFEGRPGFEGIAIGTGFLGVDRALPGLGNASEVVAWLEATFAADIAHALIEGNARQLLDRALGSASA